MADYVLSGQRWAGPTVSWYFTGDAGFRAEIAQAFARWDGVISLDFTEAASAAAADIALSFDAIDGVANTLAVAYQVWSGDTYTGDSEITFDTAEAWAWSAAAESYTLESGVTFTSVALHEIGHSIGLDHSDNPLTLLNPIVSADVTDLTYWDIYGAQQVYGAEAAVVAGSVSISDVTVSEGGSGTKTATFTVTRTGGTAAFAVNFSTTGGSATANSDYQPTAGTLNFATGINSQTISVTINGDVTIEANEQYSVILTGATNGAVLSDAAGLGTIANDDTSGSSDDYANSSATTGVVLVDHETTGTLEARGDADWFAVTLVGGATYTFMLTGRSLSDPILDLYDGSGTLVQTNDDANGVKDSEIVYTAVSSGTYYLGARGYALETGDYTVGVVDNTGVSPPSLFTDENDVVVLTETDGTETHALGGDDVVTGTSASDWIEGDAGNDTISGLSGSDYLHGGGDNDRLIGGRGADTLEGGAGNDRFDYNVLAESGRLLTASDTIADFERGFDRIDLATLDANTKKGGNQVFKYIGKQGFHKIAGELHIVVKSGYVLVQGDVNGDARADFQIRVDDLAVLGKADFIL